MDELAMTAPEAILTEAVLTESVLAGATKGVAVMAGEGTGGHAGSMEAVAVRGAMKSMEGRVVGAVVETMMHYMGGVGGLGVGGTTKD